MSTTNEDQQFRLEIDAGNQVKNITFTANGKHLVGTSKIGVQVWRVKDGKRVATMPVESGADRVAASRDGRFVAAGLLSGGFVAVWGATTYEQVLQAEIGSSIWDLDFSPDSTRLILADLRNSTAIIWDIIAHQEVQKLNHEWVTTARYSPQGDRIVTASHGSIRVCDNNDGRLLVDIKEGVASCDGLLWRNDHLFVATNDRKIMQIDASTGLTVSEWPFPDADVFSCIAVPQHGKFIAYSARETVTFLDLAENAQLGPIQYIDNIRSIEFSSDGQLLAIAAGNKIAVKDFSSAVCHSISEPELDIDGAALNAWKHGQLTDVETLLSAAIPMSQNTTHHVLAGRALVQLRSGDWDVGNFNSCLPIDINVFSQLLTSQIPPAIPEAEMTKIITELRALSLDLHLVSRLYDQLNALPPPLFVIQRMRLPCLAFKIRTIALLRQGSEAVFYAQTRGLGAVEIKTKQNIAGAGSLYLVHPWIDFLLDRHATGNIVDFASHEGDTLELARSPSLNSFSDLPSTLGDASLPPSTVPVMDAWKEFLTRLSKQFGSLFLAPTQQNVPEYMMKFLARLTKPFGALLLAPSRWDAPEYRRISTENVITAQVQEFTSETLYSLIEGVRVLDVL